MNKRTPVSVYGLFSSLSNKQILFDSFQERPCRIEVKIYNDCTITPAVGEKRTIIVVPIYNYCTIIPVVGERGTTGCFLETVKKYFLIAQARKQPVN